MNAQLDAAIDRPAPRSSAGEPARPLRERLRRPLMLVIPVLLAGAGAADYVAQAPYVSTDDAFVRAAKDAINARVSGQVAEIAVHDNQPVRKGQLLFRIDPRPYRIAVDQAEADLAGARLQIRALKTKYRQQLAELQSARDWVAFDEHEFARKKALAAADFASRSVYERAETDLKTARQNVAALEQQIAATIVALNGDPDVDVDRHPAVRAAQARLDRARLDLDYAAVRAPDDGIVTRVDDLQVGDFVNAGSAAFALLSTRHLWIEANFRETGLAHMRPGQEATVSVDAYPGRAFKAHVVSMSPGTGSDFAVLPPENATGNWVKVVQRLPVRLEFDRADPSPPLFSGLSATVQVDTGYRPGLLPALRAALWSEAEQ